MDLQSVKEEYALALRSAQKESRELAAAGKPLHPAVLDELLDDSAAWVVQDIGLVEIPAERIVGTKSAGRIASFTATFQPLLKPTSEFAAKWVNLCAAHLGSTGIRDPITCFEYLGDFYVEEGNKRVSVLRHFEAPRIPGMVRRILPPRSDEPRVRAYYEFLDFYRMSRLYTVQFRRPGDYAKLLAFLGKDADETWTEAERRTFSAYYHYFLDAFAAQSAAHADTLPEEALLLWLQVHPYKALGSMTGAELKASLTALWPDVVVTAQPSEVTVAPAPVTDARQGLLTRIIAPNPDHIHVAFVHQLDPVTSSWVLGHDDGRKQLEAVYGDKVVIRSYFNANTAEDAARLLDEAVADGAQVVFTTAPKLGRATLKAAVKYPKVNFWNCSIDQPYSSVRTYYGRIFEAKFITGAIAGAMALDDRIGYIGSNPIFGVPASINAFALGAQMTNPRARIELRWSCVSGTPQADFFRDGLRVISNRDVPTQDKVYMAFCNYGTYLLDDRAELVPLASPVWKWGNFYEYVIRSMLSGGTKEDKSSPRVLNYWLGMDSGVIGLELSDRLPAGVTALAKMLERDMIERRLDPFARRIVAQDGTVKNDGTAVFTPDELLHMDWLCENVIGSIPFFDEVLPMSQSLVRELGIYRDQIPAVKETPL